MITRKSILVNCMFFLCFFPFFKLIHWIEADIQPYASVIALAILILFGVRKDSITNIIMVFISILACYCAISFYRGNEIGRTVMLFTAYIMPLFIFLALKDNASLLSVELYQVVIYIFLLVGILQYFRMLVWAEPFLGKVIKSFKGAPLGGGRGVSFLSSEPAYGAFIVFLIFATGIFFYITKQISSVKMSVISLTVFFMFLINKSGTIFILLFLFYSIYFIISLIKSSPVKKRIAVFLAIISAPSVYLFTNYLIEGRNNAKYILILRVMKNIIAESDYFQWQNLILLGGKRFLTVLVGYFSIFDNFGLGHGIASNYLDFKRLSDSAGISWDTQLLSETERGLNAEIFKPDSYASQITMDTGIIGLTVLLIFLYYVWRGKKQNSGRDNPKSSIKNTVLRSSIYITALYMIFFNSTTAMPVLWVIFAFVYFAGNNEYESNSEG